MSELLRLYLDDELGTDGYPIAWSHCPRCKGTGWLCDACDSPLGTNECCDLACSGCGDCFVSGGCGGRGSIKAMVRAQASHRCVRCLHPYRNGEHGKGEWTPCDERCTHGGPIRLITPEGDVLREAPFDQTSDLAPVREAYPTCAIEAGWRILTVHHLDGDKANCRWWNLASLCQRCHLTIQGKVKMERVWPWEHTDWFRPYVAGYYALVYEGREITRAEAEADVDRLLALERMA